MINDDTDIKKSKLNSRTPDAPPPQTKVPPQSSGNYGPPEILDLEPSEEPIDIMPETKTESIDTLISDIDNSEKLKGILNRTDLDKFCDSNLSISPTINQTADTLRSINVIKDELCKLSLNSCEIEFVTKKIYPLLTVLSQLSVSSYNLAATANLLSISSIVHPKKSELKDTVHLVYKINEECEDVYDILKKRINFVLKNND